ncbi:retrotransposon protein, putative, ty1-copia subclass [Tanacetum coccineum]
MIYWSCIKYGEGVLSQKGRGRGNGVKEKQSTTGDPTKVIVSIIDEPVVKEKKSSLVDTSILDVKKTSLRSYPPLPTQGSNSAGNTPGMSSYANVTCEPSRKALNFRTLFTPGGNGVDVVVPVESIRAISERYSLVKSMPNSSTGLFSFQFSSMDGLNAMLENEDVGNVSVWVKLYGVPVTTFSEDGLSAIATKLGTLLMLDSYTSYMCLQSWGMSSYARAMIELRDDVKLKDIIVVAMPKLTGEGFYTCNVRVKYEWKPPRCACCKVCGHIQEECPKNPGVAKNLKKPSQASRGVLVGPKVDFKPAKEYRSVSKKHTSNTSGNKKKGVEPTKEVSNSNPFDVLNSVDWELGTNVGTSNLASNGANSSGSSFWNVETSSTSTTPIVDKIWKLEKLIIDGKVTLVDDDGKPLKKVDYPGDHDSKDEVESVDNDMARSMASERVGFGTKSLLEQWRDSYENDDYDEDPYDDDVYEGQDLPDKIQDICDN